MGSWGGRGSLGGRGSWGSLGGRGGWVCYGNRVGWVDGVMEVDVMVEVVMVGSLWIS